jgi:hypothetical protein
MFKDFVADNLDYITSPDTVPVVSYIGDKYYEKTLFGFRQTLDFAGKGEDWYLDQDIKDAIRQTRIKLKRGQRFVARRVAYKNYELVPGWGIVLGNHSAKSGDVEELSYILKQSSVRALVWHHKSDGTIIFYEATEEDKQDVSSV